MKQIWWLMLLMVWACGCRTPHVPVLSKAEALARAEVNRAPGLTTRGEVRLELPASGMGTGPHDFYNLYALYHEGNQVRYGMSIATSARHTDQNTTVMVNGLGVLGTVKQGELSVWPLGKVNCLDVVFEREFVKQSAISGRYFTLSSKRGGTQEFAVPDWMFAALLEALDRRLPEMRDLSYNVQEVMSRFDRRDSHLDRHPDLPEHVREAILYGEATAGMTVQDVRASMGEPEIVTHEQDDQGAYEIWRYPRGRLMFEQGVVTGWVAE
jgi:hypothetical protein